MNSLKQFVVNFTYVVTVDFVTLNNEINLLHAFRLQYYFYPTGLKWMRFDLDFVDLGIYGSNFSTFRTFLEILFCFLVLIYYIIFIYDIKNEGENIRREFNEKLNRLK